MKRTTAFTVWAGGALVVTGVLAVLSSGPDVAVTANGTSVAAVAAAGLDITELRRLLAGAVAPEPAHVSITVGTCTVVLRPHELGVAVDVLATAQRALDTSGDHRRFGMSWSKGKNVTPVLRVYDRDLRSAIDRVLAAASVPESHGRLLYKRGVLTSTAPSAGQTTTRESIERAIRQAVMRLKLPERIDVPVTVQPAHVSAAAVEALAARARLVTASAFTTRAGERTAPLAGSDLAPHLTVEGVGDTSGHPLTLGLDSAAGSRLMGPLADRLSYDAQEPTLAAPAPTKVLAAQGATLWRPKPAAVRLVRGGRPGQSVTADAALAAFVRHLRSPRPASVVDIPVTSKQPFVSDTGARSINSLLGTFTTPFQCCPPRVTNIRLMARTIDGTVIAPGKTFSLNGIVGRRTAAKGYVDAPFILDGELSSDVGGGVSQVATTTMNAAFFAGVRLDKHQAHSFYISRYPPGREATVNYPSIDLAWTNTTNAPILVRAATTSTSLTVSLYGRDDGRTVQAVSGPRTPVAGRDFRIRIGRIVRVPGRPAQEDGFTTTYNKPPEGE